MADHPEIRLRYFDARARAQFLRAYFAARGIEYIDERVPLDAGFASWQAMRPDRSLSGPLQRLPVLHYGDELIPETLVIAGFVHRSCGDAAALDKADNLRHDVILSSASSDLLMPVALLIWAGLLFDGIDLPKYASASLDRLRRTLEVLETSMAEWGWVTGMHRRPVTVADCMLWETIDQASTLFADRLGLDDHPLLARFHAEHPAGDTFRQLLADHPCQITGRPAEADAIREIQASLNDR
jgi:hypothetical protein